MGPSFLLDKLSEVAESPCLGDKMKYVFGRSRSEDEYFSILVAGVEGLSGHVIVGAALKAGFGADMEVQE
ncbi:hypothetical protein Tco_0247793 [Tanacetum coccineum]